MSAKTMAGHIASVRRKKEKMIGTSQLVKARVDQVRNTAGGASFKVTPWTQLERFLILGSEGGSYYASEKKLTVDNAKNVQKCIKEDGTSVVDMVVEISKEGRAPKNDPALMTLALAATQGDRETRGYAMAMLPDVARTGTHLFHFVEFASALRGWGRLLREGVANWYNRLDETKLAYQLIKYQQRDGWSHRDLLRLSHPKPETPLRSNLYRYVVKGAEAIKQGDLMPEIVIAFEKAKTADTAELVKLIQDYNLPRECVPTEKLNEIRVWDALSQNMPLTALIRNLGKMTNIGLLRDGAEETAVIVNKLTNGDFLKKARVHPFTLLLALNQYIQGRGQSFTRSDGSSTTPMTWNPLAQINNALDEAFYQAFGFIEPSGKRTLFSMDVSGSMHSAYLAGSSLSVAQAALAMAAVSMRTEEQGSWKLMGFGSPHYQELTKLTKEMRLDAMVTAIKGLRFGKTDCSLPMIWASENNLKFDTFAVYTDNETYQGKIHPFEAIQRYRDKTGINAKLVVVGMTATPFTIADPNDNGMLDVAGFDTTAPQVIADFTADRF